MLLKKLKKKKNTPVYTTPLWLMLWLRFHWRHGYISVIESCSVSTKITFFLLLVCTCEVNMEYLTCDSEKCVQIFTSFLSLVLNGVQTKLAMSFNYPCLMDLAREFWKQKQLKHHLISVQCGECDSPVYGFYFLFFWIDLLLPIPEKALVTAKMHWRAL